MNAGLWVDHREAFIVFLSRGGEETKHIQSDVEKKLFRPGEPANGQVPADDLRQRGSSAHLARYYDEILSCLRGAGSILILGPGEAKGELKRRFIRLNGDTHAIAIGSAEKMTVPQLVARVRLHFRGEAPRR